MSDEPVEIVARPPSSPIAAILLIVCCLGTGLAIAVIWWELFTEYQPGTGPGAPPQDPEMKKHDVRKDAENHTIDHYKLDFGDKNVDVAVQEELGVGEKIGDLSAAGAPSSGGGGGDEGGGEAPPPAPPGEGEGGGG